MNLPQLRASLALWRSRLAWRTMRWEFHRRHNNPAGIAKWEKLRREAIARIILRKRQIDEKLHPRKTYAMYDSIDVKVIPNNAEAVAGYVDGKWPTYKDLLKRFPHAHHLSIAVFASEDAECLDVEQGNAKPTQVAAWVKRQHDRGVNRPVIYSSLSDMPKILGLLAKAGIPRRAVRLWTAHYSFKAHLCDANCGFGFGTQADATQWTDKALGRNLDQSLCAPNFF